MRRALLVPLVLLAVALVPVAGSDATAPAKAWEPTRNHALTEPKQIYSHDGILKVHLTARPSTAKVAGSRLHIQGYNGGFIGPTLHVHPGDTIRMRLTNDTSLPTNIHFHGMHVSPKGKSDNVFRDMKPHRTYKVHVHVPRDQVPGSYWYHPHMHGVVETQIFGGMSGLLEVEGLGKRLPAGLKGVRSRQILLKDVQTEKGKPDRIASLGDIDPSKPTTRLVNGQLKPRFAIGSGDTQLWHIGNIGADLFYKVHVPGMKFTVIAEDGNPVWKTFTRKSLVLPPGKRFDVLVTGGKPGTYPLKTLHFDEGFMRETPFVLAHVHVRGPKRRSTLAMPTSMGPNQSLRHAHIARHRKFRFSMKFKPKFKALINNQAFNANKVNVVTHLHTVEQWTLFNNSNETHPFHIHVNDFQVMSVNGRPYHAHSLQDEVVIPKNGGRVVIRIPFRQFTGEFVFHCHITGHEDAGMMQSVYVVGPGDRHPHPQGSTHMPNRTMHMASMIQKAHSKKGVWHCHHHHHRGTAGART